MQIIKKYNINSFILSIDIELSPDKRLMIPVPIDLAGKSDILDTMHLVVEEKDFDYDMSLLMPDSVTDEDWPNRMQMKLINAILLHRAKYGRVQPADLEVHIAEFCLLLFSIAEAIGTPINESQKKQIFKEQLVEHSKMLGVRIELNIY